ncbi:MAG: type II toxin-antitoxin system RelE/ParE family toxin [Kiritimatiellae bacterium]|nr:type II toxin-antitoxin system RelE/ParE family toxin [Kiritimatiellia bacterium]
MSAKRIYETDEVKAFAKAMSPISQRKYALAKQKLALDGYLRYPLAEKVIGFENLFAIRILADGNERMFYFYAIEDIVAIVHAYRKKTKKIPAAELEKAVDIKRKLTGGAQ